MDLRGLRRETPGRLPAGKVLVIFAGGILTGECVNIPFLLSLLVTGSSLVGAIVLALAPLSVRPGGCRAGGAPRSTFRVVRDLFLAVALFSSGMVALKTQTAAFPPDHISRILARWEVEGRRQESGVRGTIVRDPETRGSRSLFTLSLEEVDGRQACGLVRVRLRGEQAGLQYGDRVALRGDVRQPRSCRTPGAFDYREYLARQKIHAEMVPRQGTPEVQVLSHPTPNVWVAGVILPVRRWVERSLDCTLDGEPRALLKGIILGEKADLSPRVMEAFSDTGVVHILAVSGFNVALVALVLFLLLRSARFSHCCSAWGTILALVIYAWVTDLTPSVVRATVMGVIFLVSTLLERETHPLNPLAFAGLVILAIWPQSLFDPGFQLSFGATFGILFLLPDLQALVPEAWRKRHRTTHQWLVVPLCVSLAAQLFTAPLVAYYFYRLPWLSPVANLPVIPLVGLSTALGFATALCYGLVPVLAHLFAAANSVVLSSILGLIDLLGQVPHASLRVARPSPPFFLGFFLLLLIAGRMRQHRGARKAFVFCVLVWLNILLWSPQIRRSDRMLSAIFLDVGQGDCSFVDFPNGRTMLIDAGDRTFGYDAGERIVAPFLWQAGVTRIDILVLSHPEGDHIGGVPFLLRNFPVGEIVDSGQPFASKTYREVLSIAREHRIPYFAARAGDRLKGLGDVTANILHPDAEALACRELEPDAGVNNTSLVLKLTVGQAAFLFPGDCEERADDFLADENLSCTVLKVPHHGSATGTSEEFLESARPQVAVISVGEGNRFRFPSSLVLTRLQRRDVRILRTDQEGTVSVTTDGRGYSVAVD